MAINWKLFGLRISTGELEAEEKAIQQPSFALPQNDDGAVTIQTGSYYGTYVDLEGITRNEIELITRYREMAMQPELEMAIDDIVNESIVVDDSGTTVDINSDELPPRVSSNVKKRINDEFKLMLRKLNFGNTGHDIFRRWYIDGRIFYHVITDKDNPQLGIQELRYIDPRRIRKIREIEKTKDAQTGAEVIKNIQEYYLYNERGIIGATSQQGIRISPDSVINVNSGLMDSRRAMVLSYLHKAIKPLNQLRMVEDATVIYRLSRAPERRIFYVDVGNLPRVKAEQYLRDIMVKYRNKLVYDVNTGEVKDDRKYLSMLEDFWLPRREGSKGTEITTLPGGENLGKMQDVEYFQQKLYNSLNVPVSRLLPQEGMSLGRVAEVTRDELKFNKFIMRLRNKFSTLFDDIMRIQLVLKGVCTAVEWDEFKECIWYDYMKDNNFSELREAELWRERLGLLQTADPYIGRFFSVEWAYKHVLNMTDDQMDEMQKQIKKERATLPPEMFPPTDPMNMEKAAEQQADIQTNSMEKQAQIAQKYPAPAKAGQEDSEYAEPIDTKFGKLKLEQAHVINTILGIRKNRRLLNEQSKRP